MRYLILVFILFTTPAWATDYYFSQSTGNNANACTEALPCRDFNAKGLDGTNYLSPGDKVYFNRGETWVGSQAEIMVNSSGTSENPIVLDAYGSGAIPKFVGDAVTTSFTQVGATTTWQLTGQTQTHLKVVTQDDNKALGLWRGNNNNLPAGTFCRSSATGGAACGSGSVLYVHLWSDAAPNSSTVRVANYAHTSTADGARGLIASSRTNGTLGSYVHFKNLRVIGANGVGMSSSAASNYFYDCEVMGAGADGVLFYSDLTGTGENAAGSRWYRGNITYSAASGTGYGQGWTTYAPQTWIIDSSIYNNFMAGIDFLDFGAKSNVTESGAVRNNVYDNGRWQDSSTSYDPQIYVDGGSEIYIYGNVAYNGGLQSGATNAKVGVLVGSEHPSTKPAENVFVINNLIYSNHWLGLQTDNIDSTANIKNITIVNNTIIGLLSASFDFALTLGDWDATANNFVFRNNILYAPSNMPIDNYADTDSYLDSDYNLFYRVSSSYILKSGVTNHTLATWQAATSEDANSVNADPLFVTASDTSPDVHLQAGSPARDAGMQSAFTPPAWLPSDIFPDGGGVVGATLADGTDDNVSVAIDMGYHYPTTGGSGTGLGLTINGVTINGVTAN